MDIVGTHWADEMVRLGVTWPHYQSSTPTFRRERFNQKKRLQLWLILTHIRFPFLSKFKEFTKIFRLISSHPMSNIPLVTELVYWNGILCTRFCTRSWKLTPLKINFVSYIGYFFHFLKCKDLMTWGDFGEDEHWRWANPSTDISRVSI